jgi:ppGpp synthetase/RelA/SpoT-type nucleotidyltranferase
VQNGQRKQLQKQGIYEKKHLAVEPKVTELMKTIQENSGGEFVQLDQRVKSTDSLARKIDRDAVQN